jgi:hypothetical protein
MVGFRLLIDLLHAALLGQTNHADFIRAQKGGPANQFGTGIMRSSILPVILLIALEYVP